MYLIEPIRNGKRITDGAIALAMQVYILQNVFLDDDILFPYYCDPKVEIGKFQNAVIETNQEYLKEHDIPVVRRDTGGGAVYVDSGAVNICYLMKDHGQFGDFKRAYEPAIKALKTLGASSVEMRGRNDLVIDGKKVSGAAMTIVNGRIYGGYSLLLDVDFDAMEKVLNPNRKKIESKGIKSVRARVTNIVDHLSDKITVQEFSDAILAQMKEEYPEMDEYVLSDAELSEIQAMRDNQFATWDWTYGKAPEYTIERGVRYPAGKITTYANVENSTIKSVKIFGDFFGVKPVDDIEKMLEGVRYDYKDVLAALKTVDTSQYFSRMTPEEITKAIVD